MSRCSHGVTRSTFCPLCQREQRQATVRPRPRAARAPRRLQQFLVFAEELFDRGPPVAACAMAHEAEEAIEIVCKQAEARHGGLYSGYEAGAV